MQIYPGETTFGMKFQWGRGRKPMSQTSYRRAAKQNKEILVEQCDGDQPKQEMHVGTPSYNLPPGLDRSRQKHSSVEMIGSYDNQARHTPPVVDIKYKARAQMEPPSQLQVEEMQRMQQMLMYSEASHQPSLPTMTVASKPKWGQQSRQSRIKKGVTTHSQRARTSVVSEERLVFSLPTSVQEELAREEHDAAQFGVVCRGRLARTAVVTATNTPSSNL